MMIYLAKVDGNVTEREKDIIIGNAASITKLTKSEQSFIIELMKEKSQLPTFPERFSFYTSKTAVAIAIKKLRNLAIDGDGNVSKLENSLLLRFEELSNKNISGRLFFIKNFVTTYQVSIPILLAILGLVVYNILN